MLLSSHNTIAEAVIQQLSQNNLLQDLANNWSQRNRSVAADVYCIVLFVDRNNIGVFPHTWQATAQQWLVVEVSTCGSNCWACQFEHANTHPIGSRSFRCSKVHNSNGYLKHRMCLKLACPEEEQWGSLCHQCMRRNSWQTINLTLLQFAKDMICSRHLS